MSKIRVTNELHHWIDWKHSPKKKIPARSHTFVEIGHEIISTVILLLKKGCCQLQAKICA